MIFSQTSKKVTSALFLCVLFYSIHNSSSFAQNYIARVEASSNKWILIDEKGKQIGKNNFGHLGPIGEQMIAAREGARWGYINLNGEWRIPALYGNIYPFSSGLALVAKEPGKFQYINKKGEVVPAGPFSTAVPCVDSVFFAKKEQDYAFRLYNYKGKELDPKKIYKEVFAFKNGYGIVRTKDGWQIINTKGEVLFQNEDCSYIKDIQDGMFAFRSKGKWGFIDSTFKIAIEAKYNSYTPFSQNYAIVENQSGEKILIGKDGKRIDWLKGYDDIGKVSGGMVAVKKDGKWGYVNIQDQQVISCKFKAVKPFSSGIALVKNESDLWGYINKEGEWQIKPDLLGGKQCKYGFVLVKFKDNSWGFLSSNGVKMTEKYNHAYSFEKVAGKSNEEETEEDSVTE